VAYICGMHSLFSVLVQLEMTAELEPALSTSGLDLGMTALKVRCYLQKGESCYATWNSTLQHQMGGRVLFELLRSDKIFLTFSAAYAYVRPVSSAT